MPYLCQYSTYAHVLPISMSYLYQCSTYGNVLLMSISYLYQWSTYVKILTTVYPKKYAHGFCFAVLCCGYTLTDFPISIRLTSLSLWQSNDCPSASKATLMNMDKYFMWIHYERLHNHNKAKHNKTVCIFLGIYCMSMFCLCRTWVNVLPVSVLCYIQYIPRNMHTVLLCFALLWLCNRS